MTRRKEKMSEKIEWDEALESAEFVTLVADKEKKLVLTNWRLERRPNDAKVAAGEIEFVADVIGEDGKDVKDKKFTTTSKRLKKKLRVIFENKASTDKVALSILRVGEQFNTQYSVKELTE